MGRLGHRLGHQSLIGVRYFGHLGIISWTSECDWGNSSVIRVTYVGRLDTILDTQV